MKRTSSQGFLKEADAGVKYGKTRSTQYTHEERKEKQRKYEATQKPVKDLGDTKELIEKWNKSGKGEGKNRDWLAVHTEECSAPYALLNMASINFWKGEFHRRNMCVVIFY